MEIVKSRYGVERSIERINLNKVRVMGESQFVRKSTNKNGEITMFDFEGGPCYSLGGKFFFEKMNWKIYDMEPMESGYKDLYEVNLYIEPIWR
jgi:hypothetical protein